MSTPRIGPRMKEATAIVAENPGCTKLYVAEQVGPHGSRQFGYRTVERCIKAGLIVAVKAAQGNRYSLTVA